MLITKETSKDLDTLYGQFFNLNSLFDRAVSVILEDGKTIAGDFIVVTGDPKYIFNERMENYNWI